MRKLHLMNTADRDATVGIDSVPQQPTPKLGLEGQTVTFRRYLATAAMGLHESLLEAHGEHYAEALIQGDPEIDPELVGKTIRNTYPVFFSRSGEVLHASPQIIEIILGPDGSERERREPQETPSNTNDEIPVRFTGRSLPIADAVRQFGFRRSVQIKHVDGLSYDFLHAMAKSLNDRGEVVMLGAGERGRAPLVFQDNGKPYRGFLEGRVDGTRYKLLLHLSDLELKRMPEPGQESA